MDVQRLEQEAAAVRDAVAAEVSRKAGLLDLVDKYSNPRACSTGTKAADRRSATSVFPRPTDAKVSLPNRSVASTIGSRTVGVSVSSRYSSGRK